MSVLVLVKKENCLFFYTTIIVHYSPLNLLSNSHSFIARPLKTKINPILLFVLRTLIISNQFMNVRKKISLGLPVI